MKLNMILSLPSTLTLLVSALVFSATASAQSNYGSSNNYNDGVTIYEHCDFQGKSKTLRSGEYRSLRDIGFGNDSISSIRVPRGSEAVIYEDDKFRGSYARIDRDIRCFDKQWDDKTSSISVSETTSGRRDDQRYDNRRNNNDRNDRYNNRDRDGRDNRHSQSNVTAKNVAHVTFDGVSLQQVANKQWTMDRKRGASTTFQETRRDRDSVYLENKYTSERVRIDLFANDVTLISRDGRQQRYGIDRKNAALTSTGNAHPNNPVASSPNSPIRTIPSECFNFKAYSNGGNASVRFHGKKDLYRFNQKPSTGRICHNGTLVMEIGKTESGTDVTVEINNNRYRFGSGEKESAFLNNWYRKSVKLRVGR